MCSSRGLCGGGDRPPGRSSRSRGGGGSGSHYALCALGVGLIALGIVMIVWTVIPKDGEASGASGNSSKPLSEGGGGDDDDDGGGMDNTKTSSVAFVLVGVGLVMLLLSLCLGMRNKGRPADGGGQREAGAAAGRVAYQDEASGESPDEPAVAYDVPTYEEVVGSDTYPVSNSNLRRSIAHLPSYEDIIAAVENEGAADASEEGHATSEGAASRPDGPDPPAAAATANGPDADADPEPGSSPNPPVRSSSRVSRILAPLRVRRIKSDKLHLKAFRLHIRSPTHNPVTIEPITPPPQYDDKPPDLV